MNEFEKIVAKMAELAERLELKGHVKQATEIDDLAFRTTAALNAWAAEAKIAEVLPDNKVLLKRQTQLPQGLKVSGRDGHQVFDFDTEYDLNNAVSAGKVTKDEVVKSVEAALYKGAQTNELAEVKVTPAIQKFDFTVKLAKEFGIIK